jgi:hypothetical protein
VEEVVQRAIGNRMVGVSVRTGVPGCNEEFVGVCRVDDICDLAVDEVAAVCLSEIVRQVERPVVHFAQCRGVWLLKRRKVHEVGHDIIALALIVSFPFNAQQPALAYILKISIREGCQEVTVVGYGSAPWKQWSIVQDWKALELP